MTESHSAKLLTFVVATYNEESNICEFIESIPPSIAKYSIFHFQDGNSTDKTVPLICSAIKRRPHLDIHLNVENDFGIYDAWNKAIAICNTPWISFVGADDRFISLDYDLSLLLAVGNFNFITFSGYYGTTPYGQALPPSLKLSSFIKGWKIMHQGSIYKANIFKKFAFRTDFKICGDFQHLLAARDVIISQHIPLILLHVGTQGISSQKSALVATEASRSFLSIEDASPLKYLFAIFIYLYISVHSIIRR